SPISSLSLQKALYFADKVGEYPIGIALEGKEYNVMVKKEIFNKLPSQPTFIPIIRPIQGSESPAAWDIQQCVKCSSPLQPPIKNILEKSPFIGSLSTRHYIELLKMTAKLLNLNWTTYPQARQISSHILSGVIMFYTEQSDQSCILINEVESYGRTRMIDCHSEQRTAVKGVPKDTSLPETVRKDRYKGVHPVTLHKKDGKRLVIGTFTCNILVTSCVRLDPEGKSAVSVGGDTQIFVISERDTSKIPNQALQGNEEEITFQGDKKYGDGVSTAD
ncbi:hypothetical protein BX616_007713, partial [Lobosporangium transversale]